MRLRFWVPPYLLFCAWGLGWEWILGYLSNLWGESPYIYPNSPLVYTSLEMFPVWGIGGLQAVFLYLAYVIPEDRRAYLFRVAGLVGLVLLWVAIRSVVMR